MVAFFAEYDVLLTPALAERPLRIGECDGAGEDPMADFARSGQFTPFTALFNVTGQPAISIPAGFGDDGLPTNAHLVGKPLGEDTLLQVASQLESRAAVGATLPEPAATRPRTAASRRGWTPSASASARAARRCASSRRAAPPRPRSPSRSGPASAS